MEQLLHYERVTISGSARCRRQAHLRYINNGKGKSTSAKYPGRKRAKATRTHLEAASRSLSSAPAGSDPTSSTGLEPVLETDAMAPDVQRPEGQSWIQRQEMEAEHWGEVRGAFYDDAVSACGVPEHGLLCSVCSDSASVICRNCPAGVLCQNCDIKQHTLQPFHKRRHWTNGFLQPLDAATSVTHDGEYVHFDPVLPLHGCRTSCETCTNKLVVHPSTTVTVCITITGRFDLCLPVWTCLSCKLDIAATNVDLVRCGFYRASPVKMSTVVHEDVFVMWRNLKLHSPGTSFTAFVSTLQDIGRTYGSPGPVDFERLEKAYTEWSCLQFELHKMTSSDHMVCEACGPEPQLVHLDGNAKLYRYRSSGSGDASSAYHRGTFIEDMGAVDAHVDKTKHVAKTSNRCGISSWAAGRNDVGRVGVPSKRSQDETGLIVATCRHSVVLGGVNMYRGELYAYSHFLHQKRFPNVQYFASDIVCKYWPWAQRVASRFPEHETGHTKPFLSVMHATGHAYYCQITYGGFWQPESGWSIMETTEIANAFLSRAGNTTKYMTSAQRVDAITDMVLSYNREKHLRMHDLLVKRLRAAQKRIPILDAKLDSLLHEHSVDPSQVDAIVDELRILAMSLSNRDTRANGTDLENAIELVSDSWRVRRSAVTNAASSSKMRNACRRLMRTDRVKLEKLLERYRRETGVVVAMHDAEESCFPWHVHSTEDGTMSLSAKRAICDTLMRLRRTREEVSMVGDEMRRLLSTSAGIIDMLMQSLALVEEQLSRPEDGRLSVVDPTADADRYCIRRQSTAVLHGLRGLIYEAVNYRQEYLDSARSCLEPHIRD